MATNFTNIKEKVLQIAEYKGISKEKFFKELGMSYGNFKGKAKEKSLSSDALATILTNYKDINAEWLLTGEGEMIKSYAREDSLNTVNEPKETSDYFKKESDVIKRMETKIDLLTNMVIDLKNEKK